jgi:hypothetical protein
MLFLLLGWFFSLFIAFVEIVIVDVVVVFERSDQLLHRGFTFYFGVFVVVILFIVIIIIIPIIAYVSNIVVVVIVIFVIII